MDTHIIEQSVITCPNCGYAKIETMPTDACQFFYECGGLPKPSTIPIGSSI